MMSFKLTNALAIFQALINNVLHNYLNQFVIIYLNDILIYLETLEEHKKQVKKILKRYAEKELLLKSEKCEFHTQKVEYLKHIITPEKIQMNREKIKAILEYSI